MKKQLVDQSAHFGIGGAVAFGASQVIGIWSIPLVFGLALGREIIQHKGEKLGKGSFLDMVFWTLGAVGGANVGNF